VFGPKTEGQVGVRCKDDDIPALCAQAQITSFEYQLDVMPLQACRTAQAREAGWDG
jgi:hypothetical protein